MVFVFVFKIFKLAAYKTIQKDDDCFFLSPMLQQVKVLSTIIQQQNYINISKPYLEIINFVSGQASDHERSEQ